MADEEQMLQQIMDAVVEESERKVVCNGVFEEANETELQ